MQLSGAASGHFGFQAVYLMPNGAFGAHHKLHIWHISKVFLQSIPFWAIPHKGQAGGARQPSHDGLQSPQILFCSQQWLVCPGWNMEGFEH